MYFQKFILCFSECYWAWKLNHTVYELKNKEQNKINNNQRQTRKHAYAQ